jgi:ComF family protein
VPLGELLSLVAPPLCWGCGGPARAGEPLCRQCRLGLRWAAPATAEVAGVEVWAPVFYDGPARALVRALKFHGAVAVAETMAAQIVAAAPGGLLSEATLVPVPLHPARLRRRGFNQSERLAAAVARRTPAPCSSCLERRGPWAPQVGRGRGDRLAAIRGAVVAGSRGPVPARALLVDDVITTGATLAACSTALRAAGARRVAAIAYARTPAR